MNINEWLNMPIEEARNQLQALRAEERLLWAYKKFGSEFILTTSFGMQSAVLLHMFQGVQAEGTKKVIWVDTGYLPAETYCYAEQLINQLNLDVKVVQSEITPARMEALHGRLWETKSVKDIEK